MSKKNRKDLVSTGLSATDSTSSPPASAFAEETALFDKLETQPALLTSARPVEKNTTYTVISIMNHLNQFTEIVNNLLKEGWQLQGGVSTSHVSNDYNVCCVYSQALIKIS